MIHGCFAGAEVITQWCVCGLKCMKHKTTTQKQQPVYTHYGVFRAALIPHQWKHITHPLWSTLTNERLITLKQLCRYLIVCLLLAWLCCLINNWDAGDVRCLNYHWMTYAYTSAGWDDKWPIKPHLSLTSYNAENYKKKIIITYCTSAWDTFIYVSVSVWNYSLSVISCD